MDHRTKMGIALGMAVTAGLTTFLLAMLLLALAGFLIIWGKEPTRTEEFVGGLPFGKYLLKAMAQLDCDYLVAGRLSSDLAREMGRLALANRSGVGDADPLLIELQELARRVSLAARATRKITKQRTATLELCPGPPNICGMEWRSRSPRNQGKRPSGFIVPAEPRRAAIAPSGAEWIDEIKFDGFRIVARKDGDGVRLWSRFGNDLTSRFPAIRDAVGGLEVDRAVLDGEAVVLRPDGYCSF